MELHELQVRHACAGTPPEHDAVARGHGRIGRLAKHLSGAAGRKEYSRRLHDSLSGWAGKAGTDATPVMHEQFVDAGVALDADAWLIRNSLPQRPPNLPPRGVASMQYTTSTMGCLTAQRECPTRVTFETSPPLNQFMHARHAILNEHAHGCVETQPVTRGNGVCGVLFRGIALPDGGGNAALGVAGIAFCGVGLGQDRHLTDAGKIDGGTKSRDAAADDEEVRMARHRMLS